jgi:diguanylate cyclase (GGDEF)-like protein/PAS domain S-box-containing protein
VILRGARHFLVWLLPLFLLLPPSISATAEEVRPSEITVTLDDNYPPYIFRNSAGAIDGYLVDVWRLWEQKTGIKVNLVATDWAKAQRLLADGSAEVIDTIFRTPEREKLLAFSKPYADLPVPIYVHRDIGGISGIETLRGFLVGVKEGDACADQLKAAGINTLASFDSYEHIVGAAVTGKVKIFCLDEPPANYLLYRSRADHDFRKAFTLYSGQFHRAVKKGDETILQQVQQGFGQITADEYRNLQDKWMGAHLDLVPWGRYLAYGLAAALLLGAGIAAWGFVLRRQVNTRTRELHEERRRLRTLIDTLPDLIWLKDTEGVYLACNPEFERFFGAREADIVGRTDYDFVPKELADFFRANDREAVAVGGARRNEEEVVYASDGHRALLETIKTPMFDSAGKLLGVLGVARDITARKAAEQAILESQERFRVAFQASPVSGSIARLSDGLFVEVNENYMRDFGWAREEIVGKTSLEIGLWPDIDVREKWVAALKEHGTVVDYEVVWQDRSRRFRQVSISAERIMLNGEPHILGYVVDVGERKEREKELRLAARVFESTAEGIVITDQGGTIVAVNRAFSEITGYSADEALGKNPRFLQSGRHPPIFYQELWAALSGAGLWRGEIWNRRKNGEIYPNWETISAVKDSEGRATHYVAVFGDISAVKRSQEALEFLAHHDPLTELPNRVLFRDRLNHALNRHQREQGQLAVVFVDLDRFKHINDTLGHPVGDEILRQASSAMVAELRAGDTIARIGGDEFVILLEDDVSVRSVAAVAQKLLALFAAPFEVGTHKLHVTASIGISLYPNDGDNIDTLLMNADIAMYKAKEAGRNNFQFYEACMGVGALERLVIENALRGAVQRGELLLHYQPQIDLASGHLAGVEALVRWQHPELGLVMPGRFIPVAEEMGIIGEIGDWVMREACQQMAHWHRAGFAMPRVAVNLSMQQLEKENLVDSVVCCLKEFELSGAMLELEVTESVIMSQAGRVRDILGGLRQQGIYLAIDDFGTGYSSLGYLRQLPVHRLKIDYSFVRDIGRDINDEAIARAIISLGRSLGLEVVAEGVEREEQAVFLRREGCEVAQGFLYAYPQPAAELEAGWRNAAFSLPSPG